MSKIIVAGAGHGGLIAAIRLASKGHTVTVYEKGAEGQTGHTQSDAFLSTALEFAGIPVPEKFRAVKNKLTFFGSENSACVTLPAADEGNSLWVDRRELCAYLIRFAHEAGVKFVYNCEITGAEVLGSRVVGVKTEYGSLYADLVIDACGVDSPVRNSLPPAFSVQNELGQFDKMFSYRAYFGKKEAEAEPATRYNLFLDSGNAGFEWVITDEKNTDVLIIRFGEPDDGEIQKALDGLCARNLHIDRSKLISEEKSVIPVRQPLAVFVADGYAAVGDSACMTIPLKGSGIGNSIVAGTLLADTVLADKEGFFNAETLWKYETAYMKKIGFESCRQALIKNALPYMGQDDIDMFLHGDMLKTEELELLSAEKIAALMSSKGFASAKEKLKLIAEFPGLKTLLLDMAKWFGRWAVTEPFLPEKYDRADVKKWAERYNEFFESIKYGIYDAPGDAEKDEITL